jgi:hypothetical protein
MLQFKMLSTNLLLLLLSQLHSSLRDRASMEQYNAGATVREWQQSMTKEEIAVITVQNTIQHLKDGYVALTDPILPFCANPHS